MPPQQHFQQNATLKWKGKSRNTLEVFESPTKSNSEDDDVRQEEYVHDGSGMMAEDEEKREITDANTGEKRGELFGRGVSSPVTGCRLSSSCPCRFRVGPWVRPFRVRVVPSRPPVIGLRSRTTVSWQPNGHATKWYAWSHGVMKRCAEPVRG